MKKEHKQNRKKYAKRSEKQIGERVGEAMIIMNGNQRLSFSVDGYQFPDHKSQEKGYDYDANWLEITVTVSDDDRTEEYKDACLLTYELESCIEALSALIAGKETLYISDFMEPYLKFAAAKAGDDFVFGMEFVYDTTDGIWKKRKLSQVISLNQAQEIVDELKSVAKRFPQR